MTQISLKISFVLAPLALALGALTAHAAPAVVAGKSLDGIALSRSRTVAVANTASQEFLFNDAVGTTACGVLW